MPRVHRNECPVCGNKRDNLLSMVIQKCSECGWDSKMVVEYMQEMRLKMMEEMIFNEDESAAAKKIREHFGMKKSSVKVLPKEGKDNDSE